MKREEILEYFNTKQAFVLMFWCMLCVLKNLWEAIDKVVRKFPWVCMIVTITIAFIISFVFISKARAERDSYNKRNVSMQMQLESYKACYEDGKEVR